MVLRSLVTSGNARSDKGARFLQPHGCGVEDITAEFSKLLTMEYKTFFMQWLMGLEFCGTYSKKYFILIPLP